MYDHLAQPPGTGWNGYKILCFPKLCHPEVVLCPVRILCHFITDQTNKLCLCLIFIPFFYIYMKGEVQVVQEVKWLRLWFSSNLTSCIPPPVCKSPQYVFPTPIRKQRSAHPMRMTYGRLNTNSSVSKCSMRSRHCLTRECCLTLHVRGVWACLDVLDILSRQGARVYFDANNA